MKVTNIFEFEGSEFYTINCKVLISYAYLKEGYEWPLRYYYFWGLWILLVRPRLEVPLAQTNTISENGLSEKYFDFAS